MERKKDSRRLTGQLGETAAGIYLEQAGYRIVARNWRCRSGEIDIVAERNDQLVFVEVRTRRTGGRFGSAEESIGFRKRRQVMETAQVYIHLHGLSEAKLRFDAIAITLDGDEIAELKHYEAAF